MQQLCYSSEKNHQEQITTMGTEDLGAVNFSRVKSLIWHLTRKKVGFAVSSCSGDVIWSDGDNSTAALKALKISENHQRRKPASFKWGKDKIIIYQPLLTAKGMGIGAFCLVFNAQDEADLQADPSLTSIPDLLGFIRERITLGYELGEKKPNMPSLHEYYEEINLLFGAQLANPNAVSSWEETIVTLISGFTDTLDVGLSAVILDDNIGNFFHHNQKTNNDKPFGDEAELADNLSRSVLAWVRKNQRAIIINRLDETSREESEINLPHKILASPIVDASQQVIGVFVCLNTLSSRDFTNSDRNLHEILAAKLSKTISSSRDTTTSLLNRQGFELRLEKAIQQAKFGGSVYAILNIDIDQLSVINDLVGYQNGDILIRKIAQNIRHSIRQKDVVARLGGDKFACLLEDCDLKKGEAIANKILQHVNEDNFEWEGKQLEITVSIGVVTLDRNSGTVVNALFAVETATKAAKCGGKNQVKALDWGNVDLHKREEQAKWVQAIQRALREDRFELYAQIIMPINNPLEKVHYEILLRMKNEKGEIVSPGSFLPVAERYQMMPSLDRWVISKVIEFLSEHVATPEFRNIVWSVNLSGQSLSDESFIDFLKKEFLASGLPPQLVCFEITETSAINNLTKVGVFVKTLKEKGFRFALDDFGTGLSSFSYLQKLDVDYLKIDGSFVKNITTDPVSVAIVKSAQEVGKAMGIKTIAEFVESHQIANKLASIGVDFAQGYGYGKPCSLEDTYQQIIKNAKAEETLADVTETQEYELEEPASEEKQANVVASITRQ